MTNKLSHCMCGCIYEELECPRCNKVTDKQRIEELEAKLARYDEVVGDKINLRSENEELKAQLAKVVNIATLALDALHEVQTYEQPDDPTSENALTMHELDAFDFHIEKARADLAELTGGKDE